MSDVLKDEFQAQADVDAIREAEAHRYFEDLREITRLESGAGKRVLRRFLERLGMFSRIFTGNSRTFYLAARVEAAQEIFEDLTMADPAGAVRVLMEGYRRRGEGGEKG